MAGQGTMGLEIIEQVPDVDAVLVPVGGGGLLAGVATAIKHLKPHVLIYVSTYLTYSYHVGATDIIMHNVSLWTQHFSLYIVT